MVELEEITPYPTRAKKFLISQNALYYNIFLSARHKGKRQKVPQQGNILAISAIAKSDCPVLLRNVTPSLVVYFQFSPIVVIMKERGLHVSVAIVRRLMREMRLHSIRTGAKRRWRLEIRNPVDRVKQQFNPQRPNEVWVSDVTEWHVKKNSFFICTIIDLYSRRVVDWWR